MVKTFCCILSILILLSSAFPSIAQIQPWKVLQSPVNVTLRYLTFVDSLTGWALTLKDEFPFNSVILKTSNGGDDWAAEDFPDSSKLISTIFFFDSLNGFVGGSYIAHTSNGGNSWIEADIDSNMVSGFPVYKFNFLNCQFGYACGGRIDVAGVVWRTTNSGLNWTAQGISADEVFDIFIFDSLNAITLSGDPEGLYPIAKITTTNSGETWSNEDLPYFGLSFAIDFRTYNEGWSASGYKFLLTTNRGETWNEFETPDSITVYDLQFTDARNGYAVGDNGVILKLDPDLVGVENYSDFPDGFILYQNYPNPFNPSTKIIFALPGVETRHASSLQIVTLKVYDVLGNEIATLINKELPAGKYEVEFGRNLIYQIPSGVYFYQLRVIDPEINSGQGFIQTKKMIYLK